MMLIINDADGQIEFPIDLTWSFFDSLAVKDFVFSMENPSKSGQKCFQ
jgi:hypothetical protein